MGGFAEDYKKMKFDNEFHRIYTYFKCWHLDAEDWQTIIEHLNKIS